MLYIFFLSIFYPFFNTFCFECLAIFVYNCEHYLFKIVAIFATVLFKRLAIRMGHNELCREAILQP